MNNFTLLALTIGIPAFGVSIGQGLAALKALQANSQQPGASSVINTTLYLGMAFAETGGIISFIMSIMLLLKQESSLLTTPARFGIMLAITLPALAIGIGSSFGLGQALLSTARQPFFSRNIRTLMLITQSVLQTPIIFGLIMSWTIFLRMGTISTYEESLILCASGLTLAVGSLGPIIGLSYYAYHACRTIGYNKTIYQRLISFSLLSQAIIETPLLFSFTVALIIALFLAPSTWTSFIAFPAGLAIALSTLAPGIASGFVAARACHTLGTAPQTATDLIRTSTLGQIFIDTASMYGILIALAMIFS